MMDAVKSIFVWSADQALQELHIHTTCNDQGHVTGGQAYTTGLDIMWQDGPIGWPPDPAKINGTFPSVVIQAVIERLKAYQETDLRSHETAVAIEHLILAQERLDKRVRDRVERGVQGEYNK